MLPKITTYTTLQHQKRKISDTVVNTVEDENTSRYFHNNTDNNTNNKKYKLSHIPPDSEYFPNIDNGGKFFDGIDLLNPYDESINDEKYSNDFSDIESDDKLNNEEYSDNFSDIESNINNISNTDIPKSPIKATAHRIFKKCGPLFNLVRSNGELTRTWHRSSMYHTKFTEPAVNCAIRLIKNENDLNDINLIIQQKKEITSYYRNVSSIISLLHFIYAVKKAMDEPEMRTFATKKISDDRTNNRTEYLQFYKKIIKYCNTMNFPKEYRTNKRLKAINNIGSHHHNQTQYPQIFSRFKK